MRDAEARTGAAGITLNKNAIPFDPKPPAVASGIRVGTPAVTTQGMDEQDMAVIAELIGAAVTDSDGSKADWIAKQVAALVQAKPAYAR